MANENFLTKAVIRNFNQIINDYGVDGVIAASVGWATCCPRVLMSVQAA